MLRSAPMGEDSTDNEVERQFSAASDAIRQLGRRWLGTDYRDSDVFRAISAALFLVDDAQYIWRHEMSDESDVEEPDYLDGARRRAREAFALCHASASTTGEVRLLALRTIDELAINMKPLVDALEHYTEREVTHVKSVRAQELILKLSYLRNPGDERVFSEHPDGDDAVESAWQALVVWESTGRSPKWQRVNTLLRHFGLAAESSDALRHVWATRDKTHRSDDFARHWREFTKDDSPSTRIGWILKRLKK